MSPFIETIEELAEQVADWIGVYGGGPENGADHPDDCKCRICFIGMVERRIRAAKEYADLRDHAPAAAPPSAGLVYLASPYSHDDPSVREGRFRAVCVTAGELMRAGVNVFSPIAHTHPIAVECDLPKGFDFWEQYDRAMLVACSSLIVLGLDGWEESKGVQAEMAIMREAGKSVTFTTPSAASLSALARHPAPSAEWPALRPSIARFAGYMERELCANDHKPGWRGDAIHDLLRRLDEELEELKVEAFRFPGQRPERIIKEAADVANFAMMIADLQEPEAARVNAPAASSAPRELSEAEWAEIEMSANDSTGRLNYSTRPRDGYIITPADYKIAIHAAVARALSLRGGA